LIYGKKQSKFYCYLLEVMEKETFLSLGFSDIKQIERAAKRNISGVVREELIPSLGNLITRELL